MSMTAYQIKGALSLKHDKKDYFLEEVKTGRTWGSQGLLKFDAVPIKKSWENPCVTEYEIKVNRNDFLYKKEKFISDDDYDE